MSYSRFGWGGSDVYVFMSVGGFLECCGCILDLGSETREPSFRAESTQAMVDHLEAHKKEGDHVPDDVIPALWAGDAENFGPAK